MSKNVPDTVPNITVKGLKAGFVGTRNEMTSEQKNTFRLIIRDLKPSELHHRDILGSDEDAVFCLRLSGSSITIVGHPALDAGYRANLTSDKTLESESYPECSRAVVDDTNYLIAAPQHMYKNPGGTWFTINYARRKRKPRVIIWPDGSVDYYDVPGMSRG